MNYQSEIIKKNPIMVNGQFGVYSYVAKLNKQKKTGIAASKVVQFKISCGGEVLAHYDNGWIKGERFFSLYSPLVKHLNELKMK
jgi:flagellar hook protein FlgE